MLSIVKMDFDSDVEILDEDFIKAETIDIEDTTICDYNDSQKYALHDLELVPIVYTTKLEDMKTLNLNPNIQPDEASAKILKESKPVLRTHPGSPRKGRKNTRRFTKLKAILENIYCSTQKVIKSEQIDEELITNEEINKTVIKNEPIDDPVPVTCAFKIDLNSVKSEVLNEPIVEKTKVQNTCKYSHLLKLCKPCSVVLVGPVVYGPVEASQVIHGGQLLKASKVNKPRFVSSSSHSRSSEDEAPLITLHPPDLLVERKSVTVRKDTALKQYKGPKLAPKPDKFTALPKIIEVDCLNRSNKPILSTSQIPHRFMRSGLLEIHDIFSNEYCVYYTDKECNLLDYFKFFKDGNAYQSTQLHVDSRYKIDNCCWVKKDEYIQSLYPKVLLYPTSRFMRKPHPCKPGACTCCCRKKENVTKPEFVFTEKLPLPSSSNSQKSLENDDIEILDLEDRIDKTIISINKTPKTNSNEKLQKILTGNCNNGVPNTLIGKALAYKGPLLERKVDNRRLMTLKITDSQSTVIVLSNYADDIIEIYEKNTDGDLISYLKTTCYRNTNRPDVIKLMNKPNSANEVVCCWYKREYVITKLQNSIALLPRAANFIRTTHTCQSNECTCCCMPLKEEKKLQSIKLPCRSQQWKSALREWGLVSESEFQQSQPVQPVPSIPFPASSQPGSSGTIGKNNDDDCQITSVMTGPIFQPLPQKATVTPSIFVPEAVDGDDLSKEVNSLINSILERFKDVRLTINNEGKVAAALNTPVNTLSTVELKVLANILSYAQSQVDLLGSKVNSGMSLSSIINLKVDDVQSSRAPLDPNTIYKEFGKNINLNKNVQVQPLQSTNANNTPMAFRQTRAVPQTYTFFTNSTSVKNQHFNDAFSSYLNTTNDANSESITPVIENVYSLKDTENAQTTEGSDEDSSFTTVWYRKPAQSSASTLAEQSVKPNASKKRNDDGMTETVQSKKIKLVSPAKLGQSEGTATTITVPNLPTAPGKECMPRIIILPNNNINSQSLGQPPTQGMINATPSATVSHPFLIINPLEDTSGLLPAEMVENTANMAGMSHYQSKIPVVINAASTSHLIEPGTPQAITTVVPKSMNTDVTEAPEQNVFPENDPDIDEDSEMGSVPEMDNDPTNDDFENDDFELKYSPENNEEEEDCILGF